MSENPVKPGSRFVYVTYIRTTPERLWAALTNSEFSKQYWLGVTAEADWRLGGSWQLVYPGGRTTDSGEIIEFEPPRHIAIRWRHEMNPDLIAEGWTRCTMDLEPVGDAVKLTISHSIDREDSKFIAAVSGGWPQILSNLKSILETGAPVLPERPARSSAA